MKCGLGFVVFFVPLASLADPAPVESEVFETSGMQAEIAKRGEVCIAQIVRNDAVAISDAAPGASPFGALMNDPLNPKYDASVIPGGGVIVASDGAAVVANNRLTVKERLVGATTFQSVLTLQAKEGRFRILHTDLKFVMADTGYAQNTGFEPIHPKAKMHGRAVKVLQELSSKIAQCVMQQQASDW